MIISKYWELCYMNFKKIAAEDLGFFAEILGQGAVITEQEQLIIAGCDETEDLSFIPEVVLKPSTTAEVSAIMSYCFKENIPVTPRGAGTGLSGGALPVAGGVVLDTSRMNNIIKIDTDNFQVTTQPGVITQVLQEVVSKKGLFYPVDPSSKGSCFIGGNVAENSGGPRAIKYGTAKDYVLNLEAVLPNGQIIKTGANVLKNATGYNLTQLLVGSEGTLAIVTEITLKLIPAVAYNVLMLIPFHNAVDACKAVNTIMRSGITPSALEFMERDALEWTMKYTNDNSIELPKEINAHLLVELDGNDKDLLYKEAEQVAQLLEQYNTGAILFADDEAQKNRLWSVRRKVGEAVKSNSVYKEEDTVVPRAELPTLLAFVKELGTQYGFHSVCYGHAGDGNLHINIVKTGMSDDDWNNKLPLAIRELFTETVRLGGTLSGEHGIGWVQKRYMDIAFGDTEIQLMKSIKNIFDPKGILNPDKMFP